MRTWACSHRRGEGPGEEVAYHLAKKIRKFRLKVYWNSNVPENLFRNCRPHPEVVLFLPFGKERNGRNFQFPVSYQPKTITGNRIANGKCHFIRLVGRPNRLILTQHPKLGVEKVLG